MSVRVFIGLAILPLIVLMPFQNCQQGEFEAISTKMDPNHVPVPKGYTLSGDVIIPNHLLQDSNDSSEAQEGVAKKGVKLWPNGELIYSFSSDITKAQKSRFHKACDRLTRFAGIRCKPMPAGYQATYKPYIYVVNLPADHTYCGWSWLGYSHPGQNLAMNVDCWHIPQVIEHELMHAFGVSHEQTRPDRDLYVNYYDADTGYAAGNNDIIKDPLRLMTGVYDYESIMHYNSWLRGHKILWKKNYPLSDPRGEIKWQNYLSIRDHRTLYRLYKNSTLPKTSPTWAEYSAHRNSLPQVFKIRCQSKFNERRVCYEGSNGTTSYKVLSSNIQCQGYNGGGLGQTGNTIWLERGCEAFLKITTTSHFANVFQIRGYEKYTPKKVLKIYRDWELEHGK